MVIIDKLNFNLAVASLAILILYLGISITKSVVPTMAWHDNREFGSNPHALSSKSSSLSSDGFSVLKPSRIITWQVVQAQAWSQAWSISISLSSKV